MARKSFDKITRRQLNNRISDMYKRNDFYDLLQQRLHRETEEQNISDIYDGNVYKEWVENGLLSNRNNISFTIYFDSIPAYKSSNISFTPIYLTINELPYAIRKRRENTLLLGLWYGDKKRHLNSYLYSFRPEFDLLANGVDVQLNDGQSIRVKCILLAATSDLPAKNDALNLTQFNGKHGCSVCFIEGESFPIGPRQHVFIYPYTDDIDLRTTERCLEYAREAVAGEPMYGVKGFAALSRLMPDYMKCFGMDRMHGGEGGPVKRALTLFFHTNYSSFEFSFYESIDVVDARLNSIKPPKFCHRMPRSVRDIVHWKCSELRMFMFYYSIPIFQDIMQDKYFKNWMRLVVGLMILSSDVLTPEMVTTAEDLLKKFVQEFEMLYTKRFCTINIHQLLHFSECVRNLGPLSTYTCYEYENLNGLILKFIHGTWHIDSQIVNAHLQSIMLPFYLQRIPFGKVKTFCLKKKKQVSINELIMESCYSVGKYKLLEQTDNNVIIRALINCGLNVGNLQIYSYLRLLKNNKLFIAELYHRGLQTFSAAIQYEKNNIKKYGIIRNFIKIIDSDNSDHHFAMIFKIETDFLFRTKGNSYEYDTSDYLYKCHKTNDIKFILLTQILTPCVYMCINDEEFIVVPINQKELE